jgi:glycine/D-amino acid oxidase-like deaminating enzyme/nitrite reductase/ring-hydroxylating ferredoxin subunit
VAQAPYRGDHSVATDTKSATSVAHSKTPPISLAFRNAHRSWVIGKKMHRRGRTETAMFRTHDESLSIWHDAATIAAPQPPADAAVCVIGAGISGLTTAYLLQRDGYDVQVLEAYTPGAGETGRTTAHVTAVLDDRFSHLERLFGTEDTRLAVQSHRAAIERIATIVSDEVIDCDFERIDGFLISTSPAHNSLLAAEAVAAARAGLDVESVEAMCRNGLVFEGPGLRFTNQAAFHPGRYLRGLAEAFTRRGGRIATGTRAIKVTGGKNAGVTLESGAVIRAQHVVVATNTPVNDRVKMHTKQAAYRTYVIGFQIAKDAFPPCLVWDLEDPYHYVRRVRGEGGDTLIVGGEDHKTGQANDSALRYRRLEEWSRAHFSGLGPVTHRWSGQVMEPIDGLAYIGRNPLDENNVYIITGDSGNGMTHGTLGGMLIADLIAGRANPYEKLYEPARKNMRAVATYLDENSNFVGHMIRDWARGAEVSDRRDIPSGEGALVRDGVSLVAAYRDETGALHERSAVCTHLGCVVQWNSSEKSWDCPCHGSRFSINGAVLNGPAKEELAKVKAPGTRGKSAAAG